MTSARLCTTQYSTRCIQCSPEHFAGGRQLVDISPASLSVFAGGRRVELDEAHVRRVRQGWNDPIADGAVLGFAVGVAP